MSVSLVTGSSRGIGRGIAEHLATLGHTVVINYVRNAEAAQQVTAGIVARGGRAVSVQADIGRSADRQRLIQQTLDEFGQLDILVNNAGITSPGRLDVLETTEASWDQVFATNLKGPFFLAQAAAREMIASMRQGRSSQGIIINISSISAYAVSTNRPDYCMAKAAMGMMTALLAARLADEAIRVYEICPGIIASDMTAPVREKYDRQIAEGLTPIRRWGTPQDVARAVACLTSDAFAFSTGDRFHIDGGFHLRRL